LNTLSFVKMHAAGNDFIVVDATAIPSLNWPSVAQALCPRWFGIGSDGLMVIEKAATGYIARMFNPDGSEDFCADGTLCVAAYLRRNDMAPKSFPLDTLAGIKEIRTGRQTRRGVNVTADIGVTVFDPARIPSRFPGDAVLDQPLEAGDRAFTLSAVSTGTPHALIFCDALPGDAEFLKCAPLIEQHPMFPEKTTVQWVVVDSPKQARVRIWERGAVGESIACGTGACAVASVGRRLGKLGRRVAIVSKGGTLTVEADAQNREWITGEARAVFTGEAPMRAAWRR
jgi:diaminopimelate epimerase